MWISGWIPSQPKASPLNAATQQEEELSIAAVSRQREAAVTSIIAALRVSDFVEARRQSYEEIRLKRLLDTLKV
jgi:hypothetical protein